MICFSKECSYGGMVVLRMKVYLREDCVEVLDLREGGNGLLKERGSNCLGVNVCVGLMLVVVLLLLE